jgi:uncharacterized membrane protein
MSRRQRRSRVIVGEPPAANTAGGLQERGRIGGIDALRGMALCLMFVYHFAFDLRFYGVIAASQRTSSTTRSGSASGRSSSVHSCCW